MSCNTIHSESDCRLSKMSTLRLYTLRKCVWSTSHCTSACKLPSLIYTSMNMHEFSRPCKNNSQEFYRWVSAEFHCCCTRELQVRQVLDSLQTAECPTNHMHHCRHINWCMHGSWLRLKIHKSKLLLRILIFFRNCHKFDNFVLMNVQHQNAIHQYHYAILVSFLCGNLW